MPTETKLENSKGQPEPEILGWMGYFPPLIIANHPPKGNCKGGKVN